MKRPPLHPACTIFPPLGDAELRELADDIAANGLRNPIVMHQGKLLDGRNRWEACRLAKVRPRFTKFDGDDPVGWVVSLNLVRRHLTASQRAVVAFDLLPLLEKEAKERQRKANSYKGNGRLAQDCANQKGKAAEMAAKIAKSSTRYVEAVKHISKHAPELVEQIRLGKLTVAVAEKLANNKSNGRRRPKRLSGDEIRRVLHGDCLKLIPTLEDGSVNLVVTSPPYAQQRQGHYKGVSEKNYPAWTVEWMELLWDKLTDDGSVLIVIRPHISKGVLSDYVLRTRLALRDDGWAECEELIWLKPDAPPLGSNRRPRRAWESILWFGKTGNPYINLTACGRETNRIGFLSSLRFGVDGPLSLGQSMDVRSGTARVNDVFVVAVANNTKGFDHPAMFPVQLAEQLIQTFSREGDLVVDPFCGAGSTLVAAMQQGREYLGFDNNRRYVRMAQERLADRVMANGR